MWQIPAPSDFSTFFDRDFNYAPAGDPNNPRYVRTVDIQKAITEASVNFNQCLFGPDAQVTQVFMYLAAFYLVQNLQLSSKGISSQSKFPISSTSVGGVTVGYQIPERYTKDAFLMQYTQNGYGMKYLSFALPMLTGHVVTAQRRTSFE